MDITKEARRGRIIDLEALPAGKARSQAIVCIAAALVCITLCGGLILGGAALPVFMTTVTPVTVWICMGMEALGFGFGALARWISRNALAKED